MRQIQNEALVQVGKPVGQKLSHTEQRAHFALWALIKSPLIIGCDLRCCKLDPNPVNNLRRAASGAWPHEACVRRALSRETLLLLKSREVIAINQDPLGVAGDQVWKQGPKEVRPTCATVQGRGGRHCE